MARIIHVPAGIGDGLWILQKLINAKEKFNFHLPDGHPQRGKQIYDLLPQVSQSCAYNRAFGYKALEKLNVQNKIHQWKDVKEKQFCLSMNKWLEDGKRIEEWFPDLETSWVMPYQDDDICDDLPHANFYIGIYASAYSTQRAWGFWDETKWLDLIKRIHLQRPQICFVIIGASWDNDMGAKLIDLLKEEKIFHYNTIGTSFSYFIDLCRKLDYFIAFPSGLPIVCETVKEGCDTFMFYPEHLKNMRYAWANPDRLRNRNHIPQLFCDVDTAFKRLKNDYLLFDKIATP